MVLQGLGSDGGLFIPQDIPKAEDWQSWSELSFPELAFRVLSLYISPSEIPSADLQDIINRSYATFRTDEVTPLVHLKDNLYLLELFHGPTFAFKDVRTLAAGGTGPGGPGAIWHADNSVSLV